MAVHGFQWRRAGWSLLLVAIVLLGAVRAGAEPPRLILPIDCIPGETCWIVNYVDDDPTVGERDYACGKSTYNGHKGVDFAIRDLGVMRKGVKVFAAAPGIVAGTRDGMQDIDVEKLGGRKAVKGKECGNGVAISHDDGWRTQYCHLRRNSLKVKKGQKVEAGDLLGYVGNSGFAVFPHLHIQLMRGREIVDPFIGTGPKDGCGPREGQAWSAEAAKHLEYRPTALYFAGFAPKKPDADGVRAGLYNDGVLPYRAPALVFWVDMFRVRVGDRLTMTVTGPDGEELVRQSKPLIKDWARRFVFVGKPRPKLFWPKGSYRGKAVLERGDGESWSIEREIIVR